MRKGKYLEKLITLIEDTLKPHDYFEVKHNVKIEDKNGIKRQIDVLIEVNGDSRFNSFKIIIEAKNWNKKVTIGTMGSFLDLLESTGVTRGIIVSKKGFQSGAIEKANGEKSKKVLIYDIENTPDNELEEWVSNGIFEIKICPLFDGLQVSFEFLKDLKDKNINKNELLEFGILKDSTRNIDGRITDFVQNELNKLKEVIPQKSQLLLKELINTYTIEKIPKNIRLTQEIKLSENAELITQDDVLKIASIQIVIPFEIIKQSTFSINKEAYKEIGNVDIKAEIITANFETYKYVLIRDPIKNKERYFTISNNAKDTPTEIFNL